MRIRFLDRDGQRKFLDSVVRKLKSPSLRGLLQFGFDVKYSTLKNYYDGARLMPKELVLEMCDLSEVDFGDLRILEVEDNWGRVLGGRKGKR